MTMPLGNSKPKAVLILLACSTFLLCAPRLSSAQACSQTLSAGANLASAIASATAGSTICLNSGSYGTVNLGTFTKNPRVTVRAVTPLGPTMAMNATNGANGVDFDGITFGSSNISGSATRNLTIRNSAFGTNQLDINTTNFNNNNILVDNNTFGAYFANGCEGRLCVHWGGGPGSVPAGVVITNNTFGPGGCSDGIQIGSYGVVVGPGNIFTGIVQGSCSQHVDAIQGYGQSHTTITGNFFTGNNSVDIGFYDGGHAETMTDNVIVHSSGNGGAFQLGTIDNLVFTHNTIRNGTLNINGKPENGPSVNALARDNIFLGSSNINLTQNGTPGACTSCTMTHNLFQTSGIASGTNNVIGLATFVGGAVPPATWAGWQLAAGSIGENAATDGKDMGATYYGGATTVSAPTNLRIVP